MSYRHTPYHMLVEAFDRPGCAICALAEDDVRIYVEMLLHENVNDIEFRNTLRKAGGFCNTHAWWLVDRSRGAAVGASIMYRDVLHSMRERLGEMAPGSTLFCTPRRKRSLGPFGGGAQPPWTDPHTACPACEIRQRGEETFLSTMASHSADERFLDRFGASTGLCLVHIDLLIVAARDPLPLRRVLERQGAIIDRLVAELDEFTRKSDYRFSEEVVGAEATAWQRAIELASGKDGIR